MILRSPSTAAGAIVIARVANVRGSPFAPAGAASARVGSTASASDSLSTAARSCRLNSASSCGSAPCSGEIVKSNCAPLDGIVCLTLGLVDLSALVDDGYIHGGVILKPTICNAVQHHTHGI